ncbi:hypothetical protein [Rhizobium gallicum]|uniref:hypothetical protein n=1 Tax=Rhizobium gallicum TaxID=56730 RepID=UPI00093D5E8E|nr:hypothetical protein [Rhizobium gallicum]
MGYVYESGIDTLRDSYLTASDTLQKRIEETTKALAGYQADQENGGEWIGERDPEEGYVIWDQEKVFEFEIEAANEAVGELRKAFALAAYHYWERKLRTYCKQPSGNHDDLVKAAVKEGYLISPNLDRVRRLANTLKHNNDSAGTKLLAVWPQVFWSLFKQRPNMDWYYAIVLSNDHLEEIFDAVRDSGPQTKL